ncbi:hypothetical protein KY495_21065 [Massilia sp. PAMC28688]|uniref:hypothetical protein n=1 Tax=Massilia sp. PAMC28688 TaxID=2861283 RepID=UPI001C6310ED|nr:hypothetical protein [Massilia sp. PAMC28688]QYF93152.1 hypothetical protein KY495_21065 [Massilia sp. PAMC28688]
MKNYKFVFGAILTGALFAGAQAANLKEQAQTPPSGLVQDGGLPAGHTGAPYQFVDPELAQSAVTMAADPSIMRELPPDRLTASLAQAPAQSFAGGAVAAAHASPAKSGLNSTQSAASRVAEPASELLLLVALSALAIAVRRQSPT